MDTFTGVVTTGIYCRPGCPATPLRRNMLPFEHAAAAEAAGFRPCLRCRPDRVPEPGWIAAPELVCRAMRCIADGALDDATEDDLADQLGVSARHLRRLFAEHVGATPSEVARSRRALRAATARRHRPPDDAARDGRRLQQRAPDEPGHAGGVPVHAERAARSGASPIGSWSTAASSCACRTGRRSRGTSCSRSSRRAPSPASKPSTSKRTCTGASADIDGAPGVIEVWDVAARAGAAPARAPARDRRARASRRRRAALVRPRRRSEGHRPPSRARRSPASAGAPQRVCGCPGALDPFELGVRAILGQQVSGRPGDGALGRARRAARPARARHRAARAHPRVPEGGDVAAADLSTLGLPTARPGAAGVRRGDRERIDRARSRRRSRRGRRRVVRAAGHRARGPPTTSRCARAPSETRFRRRISRSGVSSGPIRRRRRRLGDRGGPTARCTSGPRTPT